MKNFRNIIFDWGGVLIDLDMEGCLTAFEKAGFSDIRKQIGKMELSEKFKAYELGNITTPQFCDILRGYTDKSLNNEDIGKMWNSMLLDIPGYKLDLLLELNKQYNVYLLSNTNELHWYYGSQKAFYYKNLHVNDFFKQVFLSFHMHLAKPDPKIFQTVLKETNILPEETLFIDDIAVNCESAASVGIQTIHYIPGNDLSSFFN